MECILSILSCLCGRLPEGFGRSVETQAQDGLSFLGGLAGRALSDCVQEWWRNKAELVVTETTDIIGHQETLKAIRDHLYGDQVDVVGIVGTGGVGKTTLLKKINNDFYSRGARNFDEVIFVTVSSEGDALKVQKKIAERLRQSLPSRETIFAALSHKRYLLLLDDVWGDLNLQDIGVPFPNRRNRCKIALTTRFPDVFDKFLSNWCQPRQRAPMVDVRNLDEDKSWKLFRSMLDPAVDLDDPSISPLAEKMVQKCDGLPLLLVTMGRAMARSTSPAEWRKAERQLFSLQGMEQVKSSLVFSFNRLKEQGTSLLPCLLYCSLYPEDFDIPVDQLIELWIGEGFLDGGAEALPQSSKGVYGSIYSARDEGEIVIKQLKDLCLLQSSFERGCVKLHDLVREVALELASKVEPNRFVVHALEFGSSSSNRVSIVDDGWEEATKVSLMDCKIEGSLPEMPCAPRMSTLLMSHVSLPPKLPDGFFTSMPNLVVLDLSNSLNSPTIPTSIFLLSELRFLSLSGSDVRSLPKDLGNLVKLRQLYLSGMRRLEEIPQQAILRLSNLQELNIMFCGYEWGLGGENDMGVAGNNGDMQLSLSDLNGMSELQDFRISVIRQDAVWDSLLIGGDSLLTCITELLLVDISGLTTNILQSALRSMPNLRRLGIWDCSKLTGELILDDNADKPMLYELEVLHLNNVPISAIVIREQGKRRRGQRGGPLQQLKVLNLWRTKVERVCDPPQFLPSLEFLLVSDCPLLRTLPLGPHSKIKEIHCSEEWWKKLEWRPDQGDARRVAELAFRIINQWLTRI